MELLDHLLVCLIEECSEIIKDTSKALRFGLQDFNQKDLEQKTSLSRIRTELNDLYGVIELLNEHNLELDLDRELINNKKDKVRKYMEYAKERGRIQCQ